MSVCSSQDSFNQAVDSALKFERNKINKDNKTVFIIGTIMYVIFMVWAVLLAFKEPPEHRVIHFVLAIVFPPIYIISHYFNMMKD